MYTAKIVFILSLFSLIVQAELKNDFTFDINGGYNSNPLRLSDQLSEKKSSFFHQYYFRSRHAYELNEDEELKASFYVKYDNYLDVSEANKFSSKLKLEWENNFDKYRLTNGLEAGYYNKTYVSRQSGLKSTYQGKSTEDRYDKYRIGFFSDSSYVFSKSLKAYFDFAYFYNNYINDYEDLNLRRLDYHQFSFEPKLRYRPTKQWTFKLSPAYTRRNYIGRPEDDINGSRIEGSKLHYDIYEFDISAKYKDFEVGIDLYKRRGSGSKYNDFNKDKLYAEYEYETSYGNFIFEAAYYRQRYEVERTSRLDDIDDSGKKRQGFSYSIRYEKELLGGEFYVELSYTKENDDREVYDFDQSLISIGYEYKF